MTDPNLLLAAQAMRACETIFPEGTIICFSVFIPTGVDNEWNTVLRINVEQPDELLAETIKLIQRARTATPVDLRDVVGGMQ